MTPKITPWIATVMAVWLGACAEPSGRPGGAPCDVLHPCHRYALCSPDGFCRLDDRIDGLPGLEEPGASSILSELNLTQCREGRAGACGQIGAVLATSARDIWQHEAGVGFLRRACHLSGDEFRGLLCRLYLDASWLLQGRRQLGLLAGDPSEYLALIATELGHPWVGGTTTRKQVYAEFGFKMPAGALDPPSSPAP